MSAQLALPFCPSSTSFAVVSLAKTSAALASERALAVLAAAYGLSTSESSTSFDLNGLWSKTSPAARVHGLTLCAKDWNSTAMRVYRSRLRRRMSALRMSGSESLSLLPTLTRHSYGTNHGGAAGRTGKVRMSLQTMARKGLLPTLIRKANLLSPAMKKWPAHRRLPTLTRHDAKGASPADSNRKSPRVCTFATGGKLSPTWCEWFLGFPDGWTALEQESPRLATPSCRSAPKLSGT